VRLIDSANNVVASGEFDANPSALRVWAARSLEFSLVQGNYTLQFEGQSTGDVGATALIDDVSLQNPDGDLLASIRPAVEICWAGRTNQMYQVQFCTSLIDTNWCDLGSSVQGAGTNRITDPVSGGQRFYRVIRVP
jgi:hypothetical protein